MRTRALTLTLAAALLFAAGCRQNMHNQNKVEPLEGSDFFADGMLARPIPDNTVPRNTLGAVVAPYTGLTVRREPVGPPPVTLELLRRGQERYNVFCAPCHDRVGTGHGMIVQRGYKQPPSFHEERLRNVPADYFVQVMIQGFGVMPSYATQVNNERDRWAIAAYLKALQLSQDARLAELPSAERQEVERLLAAPGLLVPVPLGQPTTPGAPSVPLEPVEEAPALQPEEMP